MRGDYIAGKLKHQLLLSFNLTIHLYALMGTDTTASITMIMQQNIIGNPIIKIGSIM